MMIPMLVTYVSLRRVSVGAVLLLTLVTGWKRIFLNSCAETCYLQQDELHLQHPAVE